MIRILLALGLGAALGFVALYFHLGFKPKPFVSVPDRDAYRDQFTNPYWPSITSPKLTTPQWIGEDGVEAAAVLSIDDMREIEPYESFIEPILQRLESIDGRAPLSIFTNRIDPDEPQLQRWLDRGVSIEASTGVRYHLGARWNANARVDVRHETEPPDDNPASDVTYAVGLGVRF